jgi:Family of unknown function (DUF6152)
MYSKWLLRSLPALLAVMPLAAHHSLEAQYNPNKQVTLKGTITKVDWSNPHVRFFLDVMNTAETVHWRVEMGSPNTQLLEGWKIDTLKPGDRVVVSIYPARDGSNYGFAKKLTKTAP